MRASPTNSKIVHFRSEVWKWYRHEGRLFPWRKGSRTAYEVLVSEVLLQRTRAEVVRSYYGQFLDRYPTWRSLARADVKTLRKSLRPIGLWRQRSALLHSLGKCLRRTKGRLPSTREELEKLPSVGQYIASAVLSICHGKREPLLDVNMARLLERCFGPRKLADIRDDPYLQTLARSVLPKRKIREFNWAMLDFASLVCTARNPDHQACPLRTRCKYWRDHRRTKPTTMA